MCGKCISSYSYVTTKSGIETYTYFQDPTKGELMENDQDAMEVSI